MGVAMSTLVGWGLIALIVGAYFYPRSSPKALRSNPQRQRTEDRQQPRKELKEKAKRQRVEAYTKDAEEAAKSGLKARPAAPAKPSAPAKSGGSSSDDENDREFARQLASVKQGTSLNASKKSDEKRQKSVKQSRARAIDDAPAPEPKVSAPSSTAGVDGDDDESPIASPDVKPADAGDVSDMLEPKASGPSVLRLTDTDKVKEKEKKAPKAPEKTETKKQRQNRKKAEAQKALREETEKQRKVDMEAQRRQARIAEGRPAKDGSAWEASARANGVNGTTNGDHAPVQPLDTLDTSSFTDVSVPKTTPAEPAKADKWVAVLPSEEEQMEMLRDEEAWSTVKNKKSVRKAKKEAAATDSGVDSEPTVTPAQPTPAAAPAVAKPTPANGVTKKPVYQQSSFAALSADEVETEWDV